MISAFIPGVNGIPRSTSGRQKKPRSSRITRWSHASASIAPAAKTWPLRAATVAVGKPSTRASSRCTSVTMLAASPSGAPPM